MSKSNYRFGGNVTNTVPASRQNIEQRTPSGVRPVASPVTPTGDVLGRSNGGELEMNKPKKMAFGGPSGRMAPGGSKPGAPVNQRVPGVMPQYGGPVPNMAPGGMNPNMAPGGMNPNMAPGAGRMPMAGGFGGSAGPGGFSMDGRANQFTRGAMPQYGGRVPGMKKGGAVKKMGKGGSAAGAALREAEMSKLDRKTQSAYDDRDNAEYMRQFFSDYYGPDVLERPSVLKNDLKKRDDRIENEIGSSLKTQGKAARGMKKGGMASASSYEDMTGGAAGGIGRLEKTSIAAKTKSQKLKKGGKVRYYDGGITGGSGENRSSGGDYLSEGDRLALKKAGLLDKQGDRSIEMAEYRARQNAAEKRARKAKAEPTFASQRAAQPGPDVDVYGDASRNRGKGGGRGGPASGGEAQMRSMGIYPFGSESPSVGGTTGLKTPMTYGDSERGNGPGPNPKKKRSALDKVLFGLGLDNMGNEIREYGRTHDYAGRPIPTGARSGKIDKPDGSGGMTGRLKKGGKVMKMAKGGKAEAFEGSAKDMAQDKKLAKKYGMSKKAYEKSEIDAKHDKQKSMKGLKMGGMSKMAMGGYAAGGMSTAQDGMKGALRPKPSAMAKGGKAEMHDKGCKCMACGGMAKKMAKGGAVGMTFGKPLPGTKVSSQKIRATTATGASMKKDGMKGQLRAKASGAKPTNMMKPLGMTKMASGGKVRGTGIAQRGTKFIGEV